MGLMSNTGLLAVPQKTSLARHKSEPPELRCQVSPAPYILRPFAGFYNPFAAGCSILCNHPANTEAKEFVKRMKGTLDVKNSFFHDDLTRCHEQNVSDRDKDKNRTPHDILSEDMFRRYAETDSRPLTPAPTLASGKSRGSRRCLTPDEPRMRTAIVLDLRRRHSQTNADDNIICAKRIRKQGPLRLPGAVVDGGGDRRLSLLTAAETLYYHGYSTSDATGGHTTLGTEPSMLPTLAFTDGAQAKLGKGQCEQLPPLASPLVLVRRTTPVNPAIKLAKKAQLKALNLVKSAKPKKKNEEKTSPQKSKHEKDMNDGSEEPLDANDDAASGETRRRGKRRRRGRAAGGDRLTSAGLATHTHQDPETQIAGILSDSQNPSSRGSVSAADEDSIPPLPAIKPGQQARKTDSFLDDEILKFLHREVDEDAIHTEFDPKRRYVLEEAYRTRGSRTIGAELQALRRAAPPTPAPASGPAWLRAPRAFRRRAVVLALPPDTAQLTEFTPMMYAARYVSMEKSKQLLYLTVLRQYRQTGYRMPIVDLEEALMLMMGGTLKPEQAARYKALMQWEGYVEDEGYSDDFKLAPPEGGWKRSGREAGDSAESEVNTLRYKTWCGVCGICERMYGRYPPREADPPDGMELSDFTMIETKLPSLNVHPGLVEILNTVRTR